MTLADFVAIDTQRLCIVPFGEEHLTVRYVSDSMADIFGHDPAALVGQKLEAVTGGSSTLM